MKRIVKEERVVVLDYLWLLQELLGESQFWFGGLMLRVTISPVTQLFCRGLPKSIKVWKVRGFAVASRQNTHFISPFLRKGDIFLRRPQILTSRPLSHGLPKQMNELLPFAKSYAAFFVSRRI